MKYATMTDAEKERVFATDVLGWEYKQSWYGRYYWHNSENNPALGNNKDSNDFSPLTNLDHAWMGMEKLNYPWKAVSLHSTTFIQFFDGGIAISEGSGSTLNEAIAETCIKIVRPDLF